MDDHFLQTLDFVAFDTETTGLWAVVNRIVELGAVKFRLGEKHCERFQSLVNPERPIPLETIKVHGITDTMVAGARPAGPVLEEFIEFCGPDSILIAHNAPFDISFIGSEFARADMPLPQNLILDTVDIYRRLYPALESYSLLNLAQHFGISRTQSHRAADDAALVWKLFEQASEKLPFINDMRTFRREFTFYQVEQWLSDPPELPDEFAPIQRAVDERSRLEIVYESNGRPPQTRVIRPTQIHWHRLNYYISAYCEKSEAERTFRLDRIRSFKPV